MNELIDKEICDILQSHTGNFFTNKHVDPGTTRKALGMDSLDEVEFLIEVEDKYNIELPDIWGNVHTVNDLINNIKANMPEQVCHG